MDKTGVAKRYGDVVAGMAIRDASGAIGGVASEASDCCCGDSSVCPSRVEMTMFAGIFSAQTNVSGSDGSSSSGSHQLVVPRFTMTLENGPGILSSSVGCEIEVQGSGSYFLSRPGVPDFARAYQYKRIVGVQVFCEAGASDGNRAVLLSVLTDVSDPLFSPDPFAEQVLTIAAWYQTPNSLLGLHEQTSDLSDSLSRARVSFPSSVAWYATESFTTTTSSGDAFTTDSRGSDTGVFFRTPPGSGSVCTTDSFLTKASPCDDIDDVPITVDVRDAAAQQPGEPAVALYQGRRYLPIAEAAEGVVDTTSWAEGPCDPINQEQVFNVLARCDNEAERIIARPEGRGPTDFNAFYNGAIWSDTGEVSFDEEQAIPVEWTSDQCDDPGEGPVFDLCGAPPQIADDQGVFISRIRPTNEVGDAQFVRVLSLIHI